jgi:zinc protease
MKKLFYFFILLQFVTGFCDSPVIPPDSQVVSGKLSNGMAYYIRKNSYPSKTASLHLVVKVGFVYEKDDEKGVAHFIEHLVLFRGTKHFKEDELFHYLESIGAARGADTNGVTSFEHTTYHLDIPLTSPDALETALLILSDFATSATFSDEAIEKERTIVLDELHRGDPSFFWNIVHDAFLEQSSYAGHFPGGREEDVVKNVSPERLRSFYKRWYRPDRMAIIAVGDFDQECLKEKIETTFSQLKCPLENTPEVVLNVKYKSEPGAMIYVDPQLTGSAVSLISFYPSRAQAPLTAQEMKEQFIFYSTTQLLYDRLQKREHSGASFFEATVHQGESFFSGKVETLSFAANLFEERYKEGLQDLHQEIQQSLKHGFTPTEWKRLRAQYKSECEIQLANIDKTDHAFYVTQYIGHFLNGTPHYSPEQFLRYRMSLIDSLTIEEINSALSTTRLASPWGILLTTPSKKIQESLTEKDLLGLFREESFIASEPTTETDVFFQVEPKMPAGSITQIHEDPNAHVTSWTLGNGISVALKNTDLEPRRIYLCAQAQGGTPSLTKEEFPSACLTPSYMLYSGLQGLSYNDLVDLLQSKGIGFNVSWDHCSRSIQINASQEHIETAFQLMHAFFTLPHFDKKAWDHLIDKEREIQRQQMNNSSFSFFYFVRGINSQHHFSFLPINLDLSQENIARRLAKEYFHCPQQFSFLVVGDFNQPEIAQLTKKYIASFPKEKLKETTPAASTLTELFPQETIYKEYRAGQNSSATTVLTIPYQIGPFFQRFHNFYGRDVILKILNQRLWYSLRTQLGKTYGVHVYTQDPFIYELHNSRLRIYFTSQPEDSQEMIKLIWQDIEKLKAEPPSLEELKTAQALLLEEKRKETLSNQYWIQAMTWAKWMKLPLSDVLDYEKDINSLTQKQLQETAQMIFSSPHSSLLVHLPEKTSPSS